MIKNSSPDETDDVNVEAHLEQPVDPTPSKDAPSPVVEAIPHLQQEAALPEPSPTKKTMFFSLLSKFQSQDKPAEETVATNAPSTPANSDEDTNVASKQEPNVQDSKQETKQESVPTSSENLYSKLVSASKSESLKPAKMSPPDPRKSIDFVEEQTLSCVYRQIPERVFFAKGCGAFGYFQLVSDVLKPWSPEGGLFASTLSKHVTTFVRFSSLNGNTGTPETVRDVHGFSVRFYTDDGNFDLVGTNFPIFFLRNPSLFPQLVKSMKRNPITHLRDPTAMWNFFATYPESVHALMMLYSDRGLPRGYRFMNGYGCHAYKLTSKEGEVVYAKFTWKSKTGIQTLSAKDAHRLAALQPDHCSRDLYTSIVSGQPPAWELYVQLMTPEQAKKVSFSPFDSTKVWPLRAFPRQLVGLMTINHNPSDFSTDVEQISFNPGNLIPGIEPSPDPVFQTRLSVYPKAALYRLGRNYHQLSVNKESDICRLKGCVSTNNAGEQNFVSDEAELVCQFDLAVNDDSDTNNFSQASKFWSSVLDSDGRKRLCNNIASDLKDANAEVQGRMLQVLSSVNNNLGRNVAAELERWEALKGSWKRPDDVPGLLSAYFHYGIDHFSISTPNLKELPKMEKEGESGAPAKRNRRPKNCSSSGCRKLRENCHLQ